MRSCKYKRKKGQSQLGVLADSEAALELPLYPVVGNIHPLSFGLYGEPIAEAVYYRSIAQGNGRPPL